MTIQTIPVGQDAVTYPDSDGQPMADNTLQYEWLTLIKSGLDDLFRDDPNVFVAGDLLWYPIEGDPKTRVAPDVFVVFGRPKGYRGSYLQWQEEDIAPQVVFEILSPGNRLREMGRKFEWYDRFGVEEYYLYDPEHRDLSGWLRRDDRLRFIEAINGWTSPRLGIRFVLPEDSDLAIYRPDGQRFLSYVEVARRRDQAEQERECAEQERDQQRQRAERLEARLRELGIDPDAGDT